MDVYIIIPVYKGLKETQDCLSSVLAYTQNRPVVVINDASPDPDIGRYLSSLEKEIPWMHVYHNENNLGFVKTVNLGFEFDRQKDVIILNNDTIVTSNWVEKLQAWAHADPRAATVTPMSNSATICSYPVMCRQNPLPEKLSPDDLNSFFESAAAFHGDELIEIPTGIGFCLYIKREYLESIGYFNENLFGTGYGEENDFCMRCAKQGARHLVATDTFILHKEGVSFGIEQKQKQTDSAIRVLNEFYPDYDVTIQHFIETDPLAEVRKKVDMLRFAEDGHKGILFISHGKGGGVDKHIRELSQIVQAKKLHPFILTPLKGRGVGLASASSREAFCLEIDTRNWLSKLVELVKLFGICHLHFHHILDYHEDIYQLPDKCRLTYDFTLHDYYMFCPNITGYIDDKDYFCGFDAEKVCHDCITQKSPQFYYPYQGNIIFFREKNFSFLKKARKIISPSHSTCKIYKRYFPSLEIDVLSHPETYDFQNPGTKTDTGSTAQRDGQKYLNVGLLGGLSPQKGRRVFESCIALSREKKMPVRWILIGYTDLSSHAEQDDLIITGSYEKNELPVLFTKYNIHIVLFPAKWPETYSYTLSECIALNCPVLVPDIGALGERIKENGGGFILPSPITAVQVIEQLESLIANPDTINNLKQERPPRVGMDAQDYFHKVYNPLTFTNPCNKNPEDIIESVRGGYAWLVCQAENKRLTRDLQNIKVYNQLTQNHADNLEQHVKNVNHILESEQDKLRLAENNLLAIKAKRKAENEVLVRTKEQLSSVENEFNILKEEFNILKEKIASLRGVAWSIKLLLKKKVFSIIGKKLEI